MVAQLSKNSGIKRMFVTFKKVHEFENMFMTYNKKLNTYDAKNDSVI